MKTIRRIYIYLVTLISVLSLTWGITNLLRSLTSPQIIGDQSSTLSTGLAQILVSIPIFILHWHIAQRDANRSEEEMNSLVRCIYFYTILLASLIPVVQNIIALLNRLFLQAAHLNPQKALFGGYQTFSDNLIAVVVNLILAAYFSNIMHSAWVTAPNAEGLTDLRRLYRYVWMLYSLGLTIFGVQKLILFIFTVRPILFLSAGKEQFSNGLTILLIGAPLWLYWWLLIQSSIGNAEEKRSTMRLLILYILTITGAITFSVNFGEILYSLLHAALGESTKFQNILPEITPPFSLALISGVIWAYFWGILKNDILSEIDTIKQAAMHRIYSYILAGLGLTGTLIGISGLTEWIINLMINTNWIWQDANQPLAKYLAVLTVGSILWLCFWRKINHEAMHSGENGDHARQSISRKIYLFLIIFACVIGVMASAGFLLYNLLQYLLGENVGSLLNLSLKYSRLIILFGTFLTYHLHRLRGDNRALSTSLEIKHAAFPVVALLDPASVRGKGIQREFNRYANAIPLKLIPPHQFNVNSLLHTSALVLESNLLEDQAVNLSNLTKDFSGKLIILPAIDGRYIWINSYIKEVDILKGCAQTIRNLSEGQPPKPISSGSPWIIIAYIIAALIGLQIFASILMVSF